MVVEWTAVDRWQKFIHKLVRVALSIRRKSTVCVCVSHLPHPLQLEVVFELLLLLPQVSPNNDRNHSPKKQLSNKRMRLENFYDSNMESQYVVKLSNFYILILYHSYPLTGLIGAKLLLTPHPCSLHLLKRVFFVTFGLLLWRFGPRSSIWHAMLQ